MSLYENRVLNKLLALLCLSNLVPHIQNLRKLVHNRELRVPIRRHLLHVLWLGRIRGQKWNKDTNLHHILVLCITRVPDHFCVS